MTQPRATLISLEETPWYHVVSRCVRRAFLCGKDPLTGADYAHRRAWIEGRILSLSSVFAIDIAAYAVMSNHYHVVLRVDLSRTHAWTIEQVLVRWTQLFTGPAPVQRYLSDDRVRLSAAEMAQVEELAEIYRARLHDISWFMRVLNESIARQANQEDGVKGRFWEGRFKSQALLDEQALLAAMAYVDLNPIRAGIADDLERSDYTSVARRIRNATTPDNGKSDSTGKTESAAESPSSPVKTPPSPAPHRIGSGRDHASENNPLRPERSLLAIPLASLMPFEASGRFEQTIPFSLEDYLELSETLGRCVHPMKRGFISEKSPRLLIRLGMEPQQFLRHADHLLKTFGPAIGTAETLSALARRRRCRRMRGIAMARQVFQSRAA
ncbi:transposase [Ectothiorhodospira lacustris]|uniref:transposase n=1 Tax=Ectothiorhodospira lacustris TaxID=2899127 RepID=UPI001EE84236|nr:transposase [Ectothiorhodospira lacustris]MCG5501391.1 transposase [Ectothiorhodospira lacustris]MCG5510153.1 transposase [Ectothiorhodospira lacustris]MCG5521996.1 transposase [Ectothiorhodospira lacustris]